MKLLMKNVFKRLLRSNSRYLVNRNHIRRICKKEKVIILDGDIEVNYSIKTYELLNMLGYSISEDETVCWENG